jgi:copper resistance protein C
MESANLRWLAALIGLSATCLLAFFLTTAPALAHAQLLERNPAPGSRLDEPPGQVRLLFNEPVEAEFEPIKVLDAQNERVDKDNARVDPTAPEALVIGVDQLPAGAYTVDWRVTSVDGHVAEGEYGFSVKASAQPGTEAGAEAEGAAADGEADTEETVAPQQGFASSQESSGLAAAVSFSSVSLVLAVVVLLALGGIMLLRSRS